MLPSSSSACQLTTFFIGITEICFMSAPVGHCSYCCPRNDALDIQYKLFTRTSPSTFRLITVGDAASLRRARFNVSNPTVIYLMGFTEATTGPSTTTLRDAYLSAGDYNFVSVDWSRLVVFPWYVSAVRNSRYMGQQLARFVQFLDGAGARAASLHVVGFSLGAEAAGFGGKELRRRGLLLGRITGLDPAYPGYGLTNSDGHLARGDAAFVDVLHTNPGVFGFPQPIGDVDFYPNAGQWVQPGCWFNQLARNRELRFIYGCSHNRAWRLYAESIRNPRGFPATLCREWKGARRMCDFRVDGYMGFGARPPVMANQSLETCAMRVFSKADVTAKLSLSGKMYLETNQSPPFAKNGP